MKTENITRVEVHTVMLEEGIDYQPEDLVRDLMIPGARMLPSEKLMQIAREHLFDRCSWTGSILRNSLNQHQIRVQFERKLKG